MQRLLAVVLVVLASGTAFAQYGNPYPMRNTAVDTALNNYVDKQILDLAMERHRGKATAKRAVNHAPLSASDFKPGKGRPTIDAFFAKSKVDFIAMKDLRGIVDRTFVAVEGKLRKNNVASALGFVIGTAMLISRNIDLDDDGLNELVANLNDRLAKDAAFKAMKASDRQTMYESLMLMGAVLATMNAIGANDEGIKADAMELANALLGAVGTE